MAGVLSRVVRSPLGPACCPRSRAAVWPSLRPMLCCTGSLSRPRSATELVARVPRPIAAPRTRPPRSSTWYARRALLRRWSSRSSPTGDDATGASAPIISCLVRDGTVPLFGRRLPHPRIVPHQSQQSAVDPGEQRSHYSKGRRPVQAACPSTAMLPGPMPVPHVLPCQELADCVRRRGAPGPRCHRPEARSAALWAPMLRGQWA
jgi:hypothetical protein